LKCWLNRAFAIAKKEVSQFVGQSRKEEPTLEILLALKKKDSSK